MSKFVLKFLWLEKSIGFSLDQIVNGKSFPETEYFFWPRSDAWEELRVCIQNKQWISRSDAITILNQVTDVVNFWQEKTESDRKKDLHIAKVHFPSCLFVGHD